MRSINEFQRMVMEDSEAYNRMDKKSDGKLKLLLLLSAVTLFIMTLMVFVVFCIQQRRFTDLEKSMRSQNCSINFEMNAGSDLNKNTAEVKYLVSSLNTSITNNELNDGAQTKTLSDTQTLINNLSSSFSSLSIKLETKLQDMDSQKNTLSEIKTFVSKLPSSVNALSSKLQTTDERVTKLLLDLSDLKTKLENNSKTVPLCKTGWIRFQSKCYFFSKDQINWHEAQKTCRNKNGMLVKVETEEELTFLSVSMISFWIGLTDETTGEWRWDDGSPFIRNSDWWNEGQPDNYEGHGLGGGEDCGHLKVNGKLNDNHCSVEMRYICQI